MFDGAVNVTDAFVLPAVAVPIVGASGASNPLKVVVMNPPW
jgi:hypothetical protein